MVLKVGDIIEGKVNGVSNFGCFVDLEGDESGLVHISELSNEFVENVSDFVKIGDLVKAKVISNEDGKIALSMKALEEPPAPKFIEKGPEDSAFEKLMSKFVKESNEKIQSINQRTSRRRGSGKPKK